MLESMAADLPPTRPAAALILRVRAMGVHVFTAAGAVLALLALLAAIERAWIEMFVWLALAALIDGVDGWLARRLKVAETLPRWSGEIMDLVVDFLTYVFVPVVALMNGGLLPDRLAGPTVALILLVSVIYFADRRMKTDDGYFRGFPATWNLVVFYLFLLRPDPYWALALLLALCALVFVPLQFAHPLRAERQRPLNLALLTLWIALGSVSLFYDLSPPAPVVYGLVAVLIYFLLVGLLHQARARRA